MSVQSSFYGGRQGASFVIKNRYDAIDLSREKVTKFCLLTYEKEIAGAIKEIVEAKNADGTYENLVYSGSYIKYFADNYENKIDDETKAKTEIIQYMIDERLYKHRFFACNLDADRDFITDDNRNLIERDENNYAAYNWRAVPKNGKDIKAKDGTIRIYAKDNPEDPAKGMVQDFKQGGLTTNIVNYGEYVIIDTISNMGDNNNPDNGKVFRRGLNFTSGDLGGAEYIGQIVGPRGDIPDVNVNSIYNVKEQQRTNLSKWGMQETAFKDGEWLPDEKDQKGIVPGYIQHKTTFNIQYFVAKKNTSNAYRVYIKGATAADDIPYRAYFLELADDRVHNRDYKWSYTEIDVYYKIVDGEYLLCDKKGRLIETVTEEDIYVDEETGNAYYYSGDGTYQVPTYDSNGVLHLNDLVTGDTIASHYHNLRLQDGLYEWEYDDGGNKIYQQVGFIVRPSDGLLIHVTGDYLVLNDLNELVSDNSNQEIRIDEYGNVIEISDVQDENGNYVHVNKISTEYHDEVKYAWSTIRDESGGVSGVLIGFEFPYLVPEFNTAPRSSYWTEEDLLFPRVDLINEGKYGAGNLFTTIEEESGKEYNDIIKDYLIITNECKDIKFSVNNIEYNIREYYEATRSMEKVAEQINVPGRFTTDQKNQLLPKIQLYNKIYTITVGKPIEELELVDDVFGRVSDDITAQKGLDHHSFYRKWKVNIPQGLKGTSSNQLEVYQTEILPSAQLYVDLGDTPAPAPPSSAIVHVGVSQAIRDIPEYELTDEQKELILIFDGKVDQWNWVNNNQRYIPCYWDNTSDNVYWAKYEDSYMLHIRYRETTYERDGLGRDYQLIDINEYNIIESVNLTDDGWLEVQYTCKRDQPTVVNMETGEEHKDPIQWVNDIDFPQNGHVIFTYNTKNWEYETIEGSAADHDFERDGVYYKIKRDENGIPKRNRGSVNQTAEFDLTWPESVNLSDEGLLKFTYNNNLGENDWYTDKNRGVYEYVVPWITGTTLDRHGKYKLYFNNDKLQDQIEDLIGDLEDSEDYPSGAKFENNSYETQLYWIDGVELYQNGEIHFNYCVYNPEYLELSNDEKIAWDIIHSWNFLGFNERVEAKNEYINGEQEKEELVERLEEIKKYYEIPNVGKIKWIDDITIKTGVTYDDDSRINYDGEGTLDQRVYIKYNDSDDAIAMGAPLNYIVEYAYVSKEVLNEKSAELRLISNESNVPIALDNHLLVYYSDPAYRAKLKKQYPDKIVCYPSTKIEQVRSEWYDLGNFYQETDGFKIIGRIENARYQVRYNSVDGKDYILTNNDAASSAIVEGVDLLSITVNGEGIPPELIQGSNFYRGWGFISTSDLNVITGPGIDIDPDHPTIVIGDQIVDLESGFKQLWVFDYNKKQWIFSGILGANATLISPSEIIKISEEEPVKLKEDGLWLVASTVRSVY